VLKIIPFFLSYEELFSSFSFFLAIHMIFFCKAIHMI